jgi:hypothetical protein
MCVVVDMGLVVVLEAAALRVRLMRVLGL